MSELTSHISHLKTKKYPAGNVPAGYTNKYFFNHLLSNEVLYRCIISDISK